jgi:hypothetical protein
MPDDITHQGDSLAHYSLWFNLDYSRLKNNTSSSAYIYQHVCNSQIQTSKESGTIQIGLVVFWSLHEVHLLYSTVSTSSCIVEDC